MNEEKNNLIDVLNNIEKRLSNIEDILIEQNKCAKKMDKHIDFVDSVYDTVRQPFSKAISFYYGKDIDLNKQNNLIENK